MVKKEVGAIFAALLLVATLGAGVASAEGVVIGGGYNDTSLDISSSSFSDFLTTDLWNGSFWDSVAEVEVEAVKNARAARDINETAEAVKNARDTRAMNETAEAEEPYPFWLPGDKTNWPPGYWDTTPEAWKRTFPWYDIPGYWGTNWGFEWP